MQKKSTGERISIEGIQKGHFTLKSGEEVETFLNKYQFYSDPEAVSDICFEIASRIRDTNSIEVVIGPGMGGAILSQWIAYALRTENVLNVMSLFAEKKGKKCYLKKEFRKKIAGKKVLIVDDIVNTEETIRELAKTVQDAGGEIVMVFTIIDRKNRNNEIIPTKSLYRAN